MKKIVSMLLAVSMCLVIGVVLASCNLPGNNSTSSTTPSSTSLENELKPGEFAFTLNADGQSYTLKDSGTVSGELVIPETYENLPVTAIGTSAFSSTNIASVIIPNSVKTIADEAFTYCSSLSKVTIGNNVEHIGKNAFSNCVSLTEITLPTTLKSIGDEAFKNCFSLIQIKNLSTVELTRGYDDNGYVAYYAENIYTDNLGENKLKEVGNYIFYVDESNANYYLVKYLGNEANAITPNDIDGKAYTIRTYAFACTTAVSVEISGGATKIETDAFPLCNKLESVIIGDSVVHVAKKAFDSCNKLKNVTIGKNVATLESDAFNDCKSIENIYFNAINAVNTYEIDDGNYIFYNHLGCNTTITFKIGANVKSIPENLFFGHDVGSISFDSGSVCESIGNFAFNNQKNITSINLPDSITTIGANAFYGCSGLTVATMNGVTTIERFAFGECTALQNVSATNILYIGDFAFSKNTSLVNINLGNQLTLVGSSAFEGCTSLKSLSLSSTVTEIRDSAFKNCKSIENIVFSTGLTKIGNDAFSGCSSLANIELPDTLIILGQYAFSDCISLKTADLGNQVTAIYNGTFSGCTSLKNVRFGSSVKEIGRQAFTGCNTLDIYFEDSSSAWGQIEGYRNVFHRIHCTDTTIDRS